MPGEGHAVGFLDDGIKPKHLRVHLEWGDGSRGDDDGAKAVEDWFYRDGCIEAGKVEDGIWDSGGIGFIRFENQEKTFVIGCS